MQMKLIIDSQIWIYLAASVACHLIMILVDYLLGPEAEFLNAWVIVNKLIGRETGVGDSMVMKQVGLMGATLIMIFVNTAIGASLVQISRYMIRLANF